MRLIAIHDVRPDLLIIILVFYGLKFGQIYSTIIGFFIGLIQDILSGGFLGLSSFTKSIAGFIIGISGKNESRNSPKTYFLTLGVTCIIHDLLFYYIYTFGENIDGWQLLFSYVLPASGYTFVLGVLLYYLIAIYH